jgi:hypothetical protein
MPLRGNRKNEDSAPRILIVDDDPAQRSLLDSFLTSQGFKTVVVPPASAPWKSCARAGGHDDFRRAHARPFRPGNLAPRPPGTRLLPILLVTAYMPMSATPSGHARRRGQLSFQADRSRRVAHSVRQATGLSQRSAQVQRGTSSLPAHIIAAAR